MESFQIIGTLAFTTVTGSDGITSLVGTTGIDTATIVTLAENVFVGGNTGDDTVTTNLGTGGNNLDSYDVRMGGGDDTFTLGDTLLNSFLSLDGLTIANDGNDTFDALNNLIINSEIRGAGGNDVFSNNAQLSGSTLNGNAGDDTITIGASSTSSVYGGQGTDDITITAASSALMVNGNKGSDTILVAAVGFSGSSVYGGNGNDTITIASTTDGIFVSGDIGIDIITTDGGDDTVNGGDDADTIVTQGGTDTVDGGTGNDTITAGAGGDTVTGGGGFDTFVIGNTDSNVEDGASTGFDTLTDFQANTATLAAGTNGDRIQLAGGSPTTYTQNVNFASLGNDLHDDLTNGALIAFAAANDVQSVTITGAVAWAGNYIVADVAGGGAYTAADIVIQTNTLANIESDTFI